MALVQGQEVWRPTQQRQEQSGLWHYMNWLRDSRGRDFSDYGALWQWSATDIEGFWRSIWDYFDVQADGDPTQVLASRRMPGAEWFPRHPAELRRAHLPPGQRSASGHHCALRGPDSGRSLLAAVAARCGRPGGKPARSGHRAWRSRGGLSAQCAADRGGVSGLRQHWRHLV